MGHFIFKAAHWLESKEHPHTIAAIGNKSVEKEVQTWPSVMCGSNITGTS